MKKIIVILTFALIFFNGYIEIHSQSKISRTTTKKTQPKKQTTHSNSSVKFSIETILGKDGEPLPSLGKSLERAGFTMSSQKQSKDTFDDGETYVATIEKQYVKNGIKVEYSYIKATKEIIAIQIRFPDKSSQTSFVKTIRPFINKIALDDDIGDYPDTIEFATKYSYGQISFDGLVINMIWI